MTSELAMPEEAASRPDKTPSSDLAIEIAELVRRISSEMSVGQQGEANAGTART